VERGAVSKQEETPTGPEFEPKGGVPGRSHSRISTLCRESRLYALPQVGNLERVADSTEGGTG